MNQFFQQFYLLCVFLYIAAPRNEVQTAQRYAFWKHMLVGQFYAGWHPYYFHLSLVAKTALRFMPVHYTKDQRTIVLMAAYLHDIIEDTNNTWGDVSKVFGVDIANIVYALTNEKGKNRKERANRKYYEGIKRVEYATFVKLCDRYANIMFSKEMGTRQFEMYKKEHTFFMLELATIPDDCVALANALEVLFDNKPTWIKVSD